jgi:TonB-dependent starch-binding outer membrane protein SusC
MGKKLINWKLKGLILIFKSILVLIFSMNVNAKNSSVKDLLLTGIVTDANGEPLIGVSVKVKGNTTGTVTDAKGKFQISISSPSTVLVVSYIGYGTQEVPAGNKSPINIKLTDDLKIIDEIVVIGYGAQKKSQITGASGGIDNKVIESQPNTTVEKMLKGRVAGVDVNEGGGTVSVRVRGGSSFNSGNEPLYVIDGVIISPDMDISNSAATSNPLDGINPNDIENIEVLKDAAATAVYGSRGANGVIIVTTKRGRKGDAKINLTSYVGWQTVANTVKMAKKDEYIAYYNTLVNNLNKPNVGGYLNTITPELAARLPDTDWQNSIYRSAPIANVQISAQGGTDKFTYLVSANYFKQGTPIPGVDAERYTLRVNLDAVLKPKFKLSNSLNFSANTNGRAIGIASSIENGIPIVPVYDEAGNVANDPYAYFFYKYNLNYGPSVGVINPLKSLLSTTNIIKQYDVQWNIALTYTIKPNLNLKSNFALDFSSSSNTNAVPNFNTNDPKDITYNRSLTNGITYTNENLLTWIYKLGTKHTFTNSALLSYQSATNLNRVAGFQTNLSSQNPLSVFTQTASNNTVIIVPTYTNIASLMARINYSFMGKYNLGVTNRYDGNSNLGTNKWAMFPSLSFSWNISQEKFMSQTYKLSDLKLRASYGVAGNATFSQFQAIYRSQITQVNFGTLGNTSNAYILGNIPLPDLSWEKVYQVNVGTDIGFFKNKISFSIDVYNKQNKNSILYSLAPPSSGFLYTIQNLGARETRGLDFSFKSIQFNKKFKWNTTGNISIERTYVRDLGGPDYTLPVFNGFVNPINPFILKVGRPVGELYGLIQDGVWQSTTQIQKEGTMPNALPGQRRYLDLDGNGKIENTINGDRTYLGHVYPDFTYGLTNNFTFGKISLNIFFIGSQGNSAINIQKVQQTAFLNSILNIGEGIYNQAWNPLNPNPNAQVSQIGVNDPNAANFVSNQWIEDASYLQLRNIQLNFALPLNKFFKGISSSSISLNAQNLFTITKFTGVSPLNVNQNTGAAGNLMPLQRTYILTFNLGF